MDASAGGPMKTPRLGPLLVALAGIVAGGCGGGNDSTGTQSGPSAIAVNSGNNQTAPAGTALPQPLAVKVTDAHGDPVAAYTVGWHVVSGGGSVSAASCMTDASGIASIQRTLGPGAGAQTTSATGTGLSGSPVTFSATANPNGTISGVVTLSNGFFSSLTLKVAATDGPLAVSPRTTAKVRAGLSFAVRGASPPTWATSAPAYVPGELIVTFRAAPLAAPPIGTQAMARASTARVVGDAIRSRLASFATASGAKLVGVSPAILAARIRVPEGSDIAAVAAQLRADPAVAVVEGNAIVHLDAAGPPALMTAPSDPLYVWQAWDYGMIDLPRAWAITTGSASV